MCEMEETGGMVVRQKAHDKKVVSSNSLLSRIFQGCDFKPLSLKSFPRTIYFVFSEWKQF